MRAARIRLPARSIFAWLLVAASPVSTPARALEPDVVAADFAERLAAAMEASPLEQDRLWAPGMRDSARRVLDLRTASLFEWSGVRVIVEEVLNAQGGGAESGIPPHVDVLLRVRGTAAWTPEAYAVASAFWPLQVDEEEPRNEVVRREAWRLVPAGGTWLARERIRLGETAVGSVEVSAGVHPAQDALLVDCTYELRALADGVESCRFLLDRRAMVYHLSVDGEPASSVRGGELGALGLEGFSSESESSFRFPRPLAEGETVRVRFRLRSPLVHMRGGGFVTTLPIHDGPFRERVWYPVLFPDRPAAADGGARDGTLTLRFPKNTLAPVGSVEEARPAPGVGDADLLEEDVLRYASPMHYRDLDFFLVEQGVDLGELDWTSYEFSPFRLAGGLPFLPSLGGWSGDGDPPGTESALASIDPHPRSRRAIVEPLLAGSGRAAEDLTSEIEQLLPLDIEQIEELFDDSSTDAAGNTGEPDRN
ncbi:MAG: hypothetical protein ACT4PE_17860 [Candidatus Eiseniibacteriota bacterium]